jgi:anti-sigma B factor antagonist
MAISIGLREIGRVIVLDVSGESSVMDGTTLQQAVRRLTREGKRYFVLNLADLKHLDSFGVGQIVATYIGVRDQKGDINVANPNSRVRDVLKYTRIDTVLQLFHSETEAIQELERIATASN